MTRRFPALDPLEISTEFVVGLRVAPPQVLPRVAPGDTPLAALRDVILETLQRPPCLVSFSGGRDSSAILALATDVARAHGLDLPIPMSLRFPAAPRSDETNWQELVVRHLGLTEWNRVDLADELEVLGPWARSLLLRVGCYYPRNLHLLMPVVAEAAGGSLLTGVGGDETFQHFPTRRELLTALARSRSRGRVRDVAPVVVPTSVRRQIVRRYGRFRLSWLRADAQDVLARRWSELDARGVTTFQRALDDFLGSRHLELISQLPVVGDSNDVLVKSPFLDPRFHSVLSQQLPPTGFPSRTAAMNQLFGDLLPPALVARSSKAVFTEALWGEASKTFAQNWDGVGVDESVVDPEALQTQWRRTSPNWRSWGLLQQAWLNSQPPVLPTPAPGAR